MSRISSKPLFLQVRDALRERIASGQWKQGQFIPNEMDLARELGVSPGTARKAVELLESDLLVVRRQGRGTVVSDLASPQLTDRFNKLCDTDGKRVGDEIKTLRISLGPASEAEREHLRLAAQDHVYRIGRLRSHEGKAYKFEEAVLPAAMFPDLDDRELRSHRLADIARSYSVLLVRAEERVALGPCSAPAADVLGIEAGTSVLILDRIVTARDGGPAEWRRAECIFSDVHYSVDLK